jgi:hypothetical protein
VLQSDQEGSVQITWHTTPPSPAQLTAWRQLWARLLGPADRGPETPQPQDLLHPGAATFATVSGGHNLNEDTTNDSRIALHRK